MKNYFFIILFFPFLISCNSSNISSLPNRFALTLGNDEIIISSPKGYCINEGTQRRHSAGFSITISDCFEVYDNKMLTLVRSPVRTLVAITVSDKKIRSEDDYNSLDKLIMSGKLDEALGRIDEPAKIINRNRSKAKGVYYMCFEEEVVDPELEATSQSKNFCRAVFIIKQRIISLVGSEYSTQYTDDKRMQNLIKDTVSAILNSNRINEA